MVISDQSYKSTNKMLQTTYWHVCEWLRPYGALIIRKRIIKGEGQLSRNVITVRLLEYLVDFQIYDQEWCFLIYTGQIWVIIFKLNKFSFG